MTADTSSGATTEGYGAAPVDTHETRTLATYLAGFSADDLPPELIHEAKRSLLDWIGCVYAAKDAPPVAQLLAVMRNAGGRDAATVIGHKTRLGLLEAPIANGQMGHLLDYDPLHLSGDGVRLFACSPILPALLALSERDRTSGMAFIAAMTAGFEAGVRAGATVPGHQDSDWHLTGTLGAIAAAGAVAKLRGLDAERTQNALGIAATQAAGMRHNRGTAGKSFHAGKSAANGLLAGLLAEQGFDTHPEVFEGRMGFAALFGDPPRPHELIVGLGESFAIMDNGHKPYPCGIFLNAVIDSVIGVARQADVAADAVETLTLHMHPHVISVTGGAAGVSVLQAKFSLEHVASAAFLDRALGEAQFTEARVFAADIKAFRPKLVFVPEADYGRTQAKAILKANGVEHVFDVPYASGTRNNPMSDAQIDEKFLANVAGHLSDAEARAVRDFVWGFETRDDVGQLMRLIA